MKTILTSFYDKYGKWVWLAAVLCVSLWVLHGCFSKPPKPTMPARPVKTAVVFEKDVPVSIEGFGNLNAPNNVDIKSQVTGQITGVQFVEGQEVKKGALLFTIDPRPFQAELEKAQAALIQDQADYKMKKDTLERNRGLLASKLISQQDFDQYQTNTATAEAKMKLDQAQIDLAQINLDYCSIRSPIDGRTGKRDVDPGNIVQANTGATLVNIKTVEDLYVDFSVPETELPRIREAKDKEKLKVETAVEGDVKSPYAGQLEFLDNAVDNTTGTIFLRAVLPNDDRTLWPGQFVHVRLILGTQKSAVTVPYEAVQMGQKGSYIFVITPDQKADLRYVKTGNRLGNDIVIAEGVKLNETVVISGQMGLSPGVSVIDISSQKAHAKASESAHKKFIFF